MSEDVLENACVKRDRSEAKYFPTFFASVSAANAAQVWKRKSVSIVSPKSGRILKFNTPKRLSSIDESDRNNVEKKEKQSFFSKLFVDKSKVSDFEYQQSKVRKNSSYKPFWATKVVEPNNPEPEMTVKKSNTLQEGNFNKSNIFKRWTAASPKVSFKKQNDVDKTEITKTLSVVDHHRIYRLKMPAWYNGSDMFMSTGEQIFWV